MDSKVIITNSHSHGFAFGHAPDPINEQVFVPIHVAEGLILKSSDVIHAVLVPNYADKSDSGTAYMAVKILELNGRNMVADPIVKPEPIPEPRIIEPVVDDAVAEAEAPATDMSREEVDRLVLGFISETTYCTTSEISENLGIPHKTAGNSAMRAFTSGLISKADVHSKVGQRRPTFVMWAMEVARFIDYT